MVSDGFRSFLLLVTTVTTLITAAKETNVTMDESSVAEEPKFSLSYISIVPEEPLISA